MRRRKFMLGTTAGAAALVHGLGESRISRGAETAGPSAIDAHIHFFGPGRDPLLLPADWQKVAHPCGVRQAVVIESSPDIEDNRRLLGLAMEHPWIVGVVGRLPVGEEGFDSLLDRFAANRRFRGIRLRSDAVLTGLDQAAYVRDLERLADKGLSVDVIGPTQLLAAERLATLLPQLRVFLEHMAGARITGDKPDPGWLDGIAAAARHPERFLKVSHVIQSADRDAAAAGLDGYAAWLEAVWHAFGDERVVFGSDWPPSRRHATYARIVDLVREFVAARGADIAQRFYTDNARRAYGLADESGPVAGPSPFDGRSLAGWTTLDGGPVTEGWEVVSGMIHLTKQGPPRGHIVTADEFGDFDLSFDWKISPRGNSGIKYRVRSHDGRWLGCEYQMIDDAGGTKPDPRHQSGALYDLYEPAPGKTLRPAGEFNSGRIVVRGDDVEHWLNGRRIVAATIGDAEWNRRLTTSKFSDTPGFGRGPNGRLMLTDYDGQAWFRNCRFVANR